MPFDGDSSKRSEQLDFSRGAIILRHKGFQPLKALDPEEPAGSSFENAHVVRRQNMRAECVLDSEQSFDSENCSQHWIKRGVEK